MAKINKATAGIMLAAVIGGGAIGASAIPAMAAWRHSHGWRHFHRLTASGLWARPRPAILAAQPSPGAAANEFSAAIPCFRVCG